MKNCNHKKVCPILLCMLLLLLFVGCGENAGYEDMQNRYAVINVLGTENETKLDSWRRVSVYSADREPYISFLLNEQRDIYQFSTKQKSYYHDNLQETVVEDLDGDGLKDVQMTAISENDRLEWYFFQQEDGIFKQKLNVIKTDRGTCIINSDEDCIDVSFKNPNEEEPTEIKSTIADQFVETNNSKDYSAYLKKTWIVDEWSEGLAYPISCIITDIHDGLAEGYYMIGHMVFIDYCDYDRNDRLLKFQAEIHDGTFEFSQLEYNGEQRNGSVRLTFLEGDRIDARLTEGGQTQNYLLRPYNVLDYELCDKPTLSEIELDSWGKLYLLCGKLNTLHPTPFVFLVNEQKDILYDFSAAYLNGLDVLEVVAKDVDGDGQKDVEVVIGIEEMPDVHWDKWYFFQQEDGLFAQQVVVEKDDDYGYWIQTKGKDIWLRFSEGNFWKFPID